MGYAIDEHTSRPLWFRAIHSKVLVVYTEHEFENGGLWAAYVVPVPGKNHTDEVQAWAQHGEKLSEDEARVLYSDITSDFDARGLTFNP